MDEYTKSLVISSRLTRKYNKEIHTVTVNEHFKVEGKDLCWWIKHGRVEKTTFDSIPTRAWIILFSKTLVKIEEEDFEDVCNPTDLELDVFKLTYGFKWMFDNRGEQNNA